MIKTYYHLTKPGIIYGNAMTAAAGFLFAARGHVEWGIFISMLIGLSLIIASSCVFNNYIDRDIDINMDRTKDRAMVKRKVSAKNAIVFGIVLGILGLVILSWFTNFLTVLIAFTGAIVYVLLYTPLKRETHYAILVGSISGAAPIVAGYAAVTNSFDIAALILFLILVLWQMPHFYSIAIYRLDDYRTARIPVLPVEKGIAITKIHIAAYAAAFLVVTLSLSFAELAGGSYMAVMLLLGIFWLGFALQGLRQKTEEKKWARVMFFISLIVLTVFSIVIAFNHWLP